MSQRPRFTPEDGAHVVQRPQFVPLSDGSVHAFYPGEDWSVCGKDHAEAVSLLIKGSAQRMQDPDYLAAHRERTRRHQNGDVTPGFELWTEAADEAGHRHDQPPRAGD
ncbi:hypothetical protein [Nocardia goodfellowii]|uniref:Uncharacterized protein n=1 Tax=Nocardia goodfellowii TaxID=882446 RepID=A0ABS4QCD5_9NOCA|nr:hypothetical protein [Nocardia goodfellowii]MBP2189348.1 hypothetical protein [Nocardia goodfellowii]